MLVSEQGDEPPQAPAPSGKAASFARNTGLDVLRTIAILLVVLSHYWNNVAYWYHFNPPASVFFMGALGVELFFALSGYLIGRILISLAFSKPNWRDLAVFWLRRWLRTLPVYLAWLAVLATCFPPAQHVGAHLLAFATLTQNAWRPMPADYWFAVSWSLAVEEWFYLLFGAAVILLAIKLRPGLAVWLPLMAMLIIPAGLRLSVATSTYFHQGYSTMVPFRLDEIGYGVILAWCDAKLFKLLRAHCRILLALGLCLILAAWLFMAPSALHILAALRNNTVMAGCTLCIPAALELRNAPSWIGWLAFHGSRLSYSIYIIHMTLLVEIAQSLVYAHRLNPAVAIVFSVSSTIMAAEILTRCVERPFMRLRPAMRA